MAVKAAKFEDVDFILQFFQGCQDANEMQQRLKDDNVVGVNALDLAHILMTEVQRLKFEAGESDEALQESSEGSGGTSDVSTSVEGSGEEQEDSSKESSGAKSASSLLQKSAPSS